MKYLNPLIRFCLLLPLVCSSCAGDYLDTAPTREVSPADLFKNEEYAAYAISGLEKLMKTTYATNKLDGVAFNGEGSAKLIYAEYQGADMYCPRNNFYTIFNGSLHAIPTSGFTVYMWHYYYKIISNANTILHYVNPESSHKFKYIYAQALTYRAYCYLQLLQFYSPRWCDSENGSADGVVLRLDLSSTGDCPLFSMLTCYEQVYKDLDNAIAYYQASEITRGDNENHKVNIDAAYSIYARAALTREDWQTAAHYAALARANYPLMTASEYRDGFSTVNSEWIWSIYDSAEESLGGASLAARLAYNSSSELVCTYPACINRELYNELPETDIRRELFLDPGGYSYNTTGIAGNGLGGSELTAHARSLYPDLSSTAKIYAYMSFKFKCIDRVGAMPFNLFRSSEMYLIEAEANCHLTPTKETEAQQLMNELIAGSGRDPQYTCGKSGQALLDEIKFYRRIELWGEGFSWFDYKRHKDTLVRHTYEDGGNYMKNAAITIRPEDTNNWMWVIPAKEYEYNDAIGR
nr:RagB/SusD family nutrient uptake outer membrane protein [uncultured Bacteroides sp.]